jgi:DNA-binding FadR family transcriptional regulator
MECEIARSGRISHAPARHTGFRLARGRQVLEIPAMNDRHGGHERKRLNGGGQGEGGDLLHTATARDLGIAIVQGRYRPGEMLPSEPSAVQMLGISRPAYREAIRVLAAKNLVEIRPKSGTRVLPRERWNLLDPDVLGWILRNSPAESFLTALFDVRMIIEPAAAALAAQRRTQAHLDRMSEALDIMGRHPHDSPEGQAADEVFHKILVEAADNEVLSQLTSLIAASVGYIAEFKRNRAVERDPKPDHDALYRAIAARRSEAARAIMFNLISHAREDTEPFFDQPGG